MIISTYAASKGIVFLNILFVPTIILTISGVIVINIGNAEIKKMFPMLAAGVFPVFESVFVPLFALNSFIPLFILLGFLQHKEVKITHCISA